MVKLATFRGGVHPPEFKDATKDKKIEPVALPSKVVLPLQQHIGAPLELAVASGDAVKVGTLVARATGFVSIPLHSPVSGTVKSVGEALHPSGVSMQAVVIESDGQDEWEPGLLTRRDPESLGVDEIKKIIRDAGIVGLGGAAFPTHVKLSPPADRKIDVFILNGAECEPYLTTDYRQMLERSADLVAGVGIIARVLGCAKVYLAVESNKPEALAAVAGQAKGREGWQVVTLQTKYPQGGEKQLIEAIAGRQVPSGKLPMDVGCVVQNVSTVLSVFDAVTTGRPLIEKVVTVTGGAALNPGNYSVRVGMLISELLEKTGGVAENLGKAVMGGPMMGVALPNLEVPVLKGTNGLLLIPEPVPESLHRACIRCGGCVDACPIHLLPCDLALLAENERWDRCRELNVKDCIECGSCSFTCPAGRNLVQLIRYGKFTVMSQDRAAKK
ncbi:electron transport complex subunit RsxC [bacterium]|nr:electron transport complex subunit RsxC [bacterium]